jgi:hypothetical protein
MVSRRPIVLASGLLSELPPGDTVVGASVTVGTLTAGSGLSGGGNLSTDQRIDVSLAASPSGIIFVGDSLGLDGVAQVTANSALASGNAALSSAATAQASGNASLVLANTALASGNAALARTLINSAVNLSGGVIGAVPYQSGVGATSFLSPGASGQVLATQGSSLAPTWITPGGGKILQVIQATKTNFLSTTSSSYVTTGLAASITPSSSSSKILVLMSSTLGNNTNGGVSYLTIFRNSTDLSAATGNPGLTAFEVPITGGATSPAVLSYLDSPSTTSSTTYTIYLKVSGGTGWFGYDLAGNAIVSTLILMEVAA